MYRLRLDQDIKPLSEFRANASSLVERVRQTKRPLVLTQRGHSTAVVIGVTEYEALLDEIEVLREIRVAEREIDDGLGVSHEDAKARVMSRFKRSEE